MTRILNIFLVVFFFNQATFAQITMETERKNDGVMEIYATNADQVPYTVLINYTELTNILPVGSSGLAVVRPGRSKVATLKRRVEGQTTHMRYTYSYIRGDYFGKSKQEPVYLIPLPEGTITTGIRMTHIQNRLQPKEVNNEYVGISFKFDLPTEILAPRKGVVSAISMEKYDERENLDFDRSENYIELFHEDGSLTKIMVLRPGSQKVKVGQVVFPGDVLADSAGEEYNSGLHVRLVNMKPVKAEKGKLRYHQGPMKFISKEGESDFSDPHKVEVVFPDEIVTAEMSKKEKKNYLSEN